MAINFYETLYLLNPNLSEEDCGEVVEKFNGFVANNKGTAIKLDEWGKKTLAYPVKKHDKGFYVLFQFCGSPEIIEPMNREFKLDERVLKHQTIKLNDNVDPEALQASFKEPPPEETEAEEETVEDAEEQKADNQDEI